jgi:beta-phosphoglucomutase-like phosphatase (HAD superfamily)
MVARGKPAPDLFLHAAKEMRAAPVATIVIEDSVAGVTAGMRAEMTVIGFCGGSHCDATTADALKAAGADGEPVKPPTPAGGYRTRRGFM